MAIETADTEEGKRSLAARLMAAAVLLLLPIIYFYPAVTGEVSLVAGDGWTQNLGVRVLIGRMIAHGQIPLWNPFIFAGTPLLASIYPGALYLPNWLFAVFSPGVAMNVVVITTYHVALIGTYLYARRLGLTRVAALIAGIAFTFGGYMLAHLGHTSRIAAAAWLPWILLAIESLYQQARWRWVVLGALFVALQLFAGEPQMTWYTIIVAGAYLIYSLTLREERERRRRFLFYSTAMAVCGGLLSAIQLLPERELLKYGDRARIDYEYFSQFSFPPRQVLNVVFPYFFGGAAMPPYKVSYWGSWGVGETCCYVGMLGLLLAFVAVLGRHRRRLVWFWAGMAVISLLLAFGDYLPFGLNKVLFHIPVYKLFRASARHVFEFTFSLGVLAGLGADYIGRQAATARSEVRTAVVRAILLLAAIAGAATLIYGFFTKYLVMATPRPANTGSLSNPDVLFPLSFAVIGGVAVWLYFLKPTTIRGGLLVFLLIADLAAFGQFFEWRIYRFSVNQRLVDAPSVKYLKEREPDSSSYRILGISGGPFYYNYEMLDYPNVSIARGLQSVNGYDALRIGRMAAIAGDMTLDGLVPDSRALNDSHQGFNILNVKYLLRERLRPIDPALAVAINGVRFRPELFNLALRPGSHLEMEAEGVQATELALVTAMVRSTHVVDGTPVAKVRIRLKNNQIVEQEIQAGRDTAEWAYERIDVRSEARHRLGPVAESWEAGGFPGHRYITRMKFDRAEVDRIEFEYLLADAELDIARASLYDEVSTQSTPLETVILPAERWRKLETFGEVDLLENLKAQPKAWFVSKLEVMRSADVLRAIQTGRLNDGSPFEPANTALLETEDIARRVPLPQPGNTTFAEVRVTSYQPQRIRLETRNGQPGFLVLSEIYYRGWEATVDGRRVPVERVNYTLRGIPVSPGEHQVEFTYRAPTFRTGALYSGLGLMLLLAGGIVRLRRRDGDPSDAVTRIGSLLFHRRWLILSIGMLVIYAAVIASHASFVVGGSDSFGYMSIARSLLSRKLLEPVVELDWLNLPDTMTWPFLPLAYVPGRRPATMAPIYPIGLPLHLGLAALVFGWRYGPYLVSPFAAALSLFFMFLTGIELGLRRSYAAAGAVVLGLSATVLFMAFQPMSDVVAMLWSLIAIWAALRARKRDSWALLAGLALGIGFLVRPTQLLLVLPIGFALPLKPRTALLVILGALPSGAVFLAYDLAAYGHALATGYGAMGLFGLVSLHYFPARFVHYTYWLAFTMSPLLLVGWLCCLFYQRIALRTRLLLGCWFGSFFLFYTCYYYYDEWWYIRYLLPGLPALITGALILAQELVQTGKERLNGRNRNLMYGAVTLCMLIVLAVEIRTIVKFDLFSFGPGTLVHRESCRWTDTLLPDRALIVAKEMSGALKFYTKRGIVRYDLIEPAQMALVQSRAAAKGFRWYALLVPYEVEDAKKRIAGKWTRLGAMSTISLWLIEPDGS